MQSIKGHISYNINKKAQKSKNNKKNKNKIINTGIVIPGVVNEYIDVQSYKNSNIREFAKINRLNQTPSEKRFDGILRNINNGVLKGRYKKQYPISGKWIVDFYFPEIRLAIEIDGSIHSNPDQIQKDKIKDEDCERFDITLVRIKNDEVYGDYNRLITKLRNAWKLAKNRENKIIGKTY
jgi:very-short-patch-repair endonuclease